MAKFLLKSISLHINCFHTLRAEKEKVTGKTVTVAELILTYNTIDSRSFRVGDASGQFHYTEWNTVHYTT